MHMQTISDKVVYIIGNEQVIKKIDSQPALEPFSDEVITFLNAVSKLILNNTEASAYPDVITFAFWCRKASIEIMKREYIKEHVNIIRDENNSVMDKKYISYGRGCVFHISPSNVAVNYAYSLVLGLLAGNTNIVRLPSKYFSQVNLINCAIEKAIEKYPQFESNICIVKYGRDKEITDYFSLKCDTRIIWGGDNTISEIRKSPLKPRANEITFADRYSIAVIDSEKYLKMEGKANIASSFYNDTYLTDQNACTSPRIVIWLGKKEISKEGQKIFWSELMTIVEKKYSMQAVQAVSKLVSVYKIGANFNGASLNEAINYKLSNKLIRVQVPELFEGLMEYKNNSGFFMEYFAENLIEIEPICKIQCQTLSYIGVSKEDIISFIMNSKPKGIDRVVPTGTTMDFGLFWDGYDLISQLTRNIIF